MPITTLHSDYRSQVSSWQVARDAVAGERAIRQRIAEYLPPPPGMQPYPTESPGSGSAVAHSRYAFYARFAEWPEIVGPSVNGLQGLIHEKPPQITLPPALESLCEQATCGGDSLLELWELITREILIAGRVVLLAEVSLEARPRLLLCPYAAESLINWRLKPKIAGGHPLVAVLQERLQMDHPRDRYELVERDQWRELLINVDGRYAVRIWQLDGSGQPHIVPDPHGEEWTVPSLSGRPFCEIPLTVINAVDIGFEYGPIPIQPMVQRALAIFRKSADYNRSLYVKGDPQIVLFGVEPLEIPQEIGGGTIWAFANADGKAQYLDIDGHGIPLMRQAIADEFERFSIETGRLLDTSDRGPESGEAIRRRQSIQLVTVKSLVVNAANGLLQALRQMGRLVGLSQDAIETITVSPNLDFTEPNLTGRELLDLISAKNHGAPLSQPTLHALMRRGGLTSLEFEEEHAALQGESNGEPK